MDRITAAQVFVDVTRSGSFTATAQRLNMSRPMVTRYIETVETWFGVRLLHRTTRKVTLTTLGEQCLKELEPWLSATTSLIENAQSTGEITGSIRVASSMSFAHAQLMPAISRFLQDHPKVSIDIDLQDNTIDLIKNRIDLAIRIAANPNPALIGKPIGVCRSVLVAHQSYLQNVDTINQPDDLISHQCLRYSNFDDNVWHFSKNQQYKSVQINGQLSANEATALLQATLSGAGVAMLPTYLAQHAINAETLIEVLPDWKIDNMNIYALYPSRKFLAPAVRALIDFLDKYFKQHNWDH